MTEQLSIIEDQNIEASKATLPEVVDHSSALLQVIERVAMSPDADISKLEKMLDMQERVLNRNAKQAFASDFAAMQSEMPEIQRLGKAHNSTYARFEDINEAVRPVLQKYGFGVTFRISQGDKVKVTGVLQHRDGHSEETEMVFPADTSGSKNVVQAIGSSVSYGKRYVLCALLNISTRGEDDDGESAAATARTTPFQQQTMLKVLMDCSDATQEWFAENYGDVKDVPKDQYSKLLAKLKQVRGGNNANS